LLEAFVHAGLLVGLSNSLPQDLSVCFRAVNSVVVSDRSWPNSAGDIGLWVDGTSDTNAADDDNNLCDSSCRQAILQAFQDSAGNSIDVLIADGFEVAICDLETGLHSRRVSDDRTADVVLAPGDVYPNT
jgi:hypothetical protein